MPKRPIPATGGAAHPLCAAHTVWNCSLLYRFVSKTNLPPDSREPEGRCPSRSEGEGKMGGEQSVIRNLDKRTARREYAGHFKAHITKWKGLQVEPSPQPRVAPQFPSSASSRVAPERRRDRNLTINLLSCRGRLSLRMCTPTSDQKTGTTES